jgi:dipeptidyl aminopeptidase/acylaminoacyl peptidase
LYNAEKIKVPVLLLHGEKDERAPVEHAQRLAASLAERDHPHELRLFDGEGHGYFDPKNRLIALEHLTTFLDQHLAP